MLCVCKDSMEPFTNGYPIKDATQIRRRGMLMTTGT